MLRRAGAVALAWIVLGELVVPALIAWLYAADARSWFEPLARALARAQSRHSLDYYLDSWRDDGRWAALALLGAIGSLYPVIKMASTGATIEFGSPKVITSLLSSLICAVFVGLCIKSFIDARKARQQQPAAQ